MHPTTSLSPPPLVVVAWFMYNNSEWPRYKFLVMMWQENIPHIPVNCEVRTVTVSLYPVLVAESLLLCLILPDVDNLEPMTAVVSHAEQQESRTFCTTFLFMLFPQLNSFRVCIHKPVVLPFQNGTHEFLVNHITPQILGIAFYLCCPLCVVTGNFVICTNYFAIKTKGYHGNCTL